MPRDESLYKLFNEYFVVADFPGVYQAWGFGDGVESLYYCFHCYWGGLYGNCEHMCHVRIHLGDTSFAGLPKKNQRGAPTKTFRQKRDLMLGNVPKTVMKSMSSAMKVARKAGDAVLKKRSSGSAVPKKPGRGGGKKIASGSVGKKNAGKEIPSEANAGNNQGEGGVDDDEARNERQDGSSKNTESDKSVKAEETLSDACLAANTEAGRQAGSAQRVGNAVKAVRADNPDDVGTTRGTGLPSDAEPGESQRRDDENDEVESLSALTLDDFQFDEDEEEEPPTKKPKPSGGGRNSC